jgi:hypothetical protein
LSKYLKKYIREICKIYGCSIKISNKNTGGLYWKGKMIISNDMTDVETISVFCHELAHYKNDIENKYPIYHKSNHYKAIEKMGRKNFARYALNAELYTEKIANQLSKIWFPTHTFKSGYKNNQYWLGFFYGYYMV